MVLGKILKRNSKLFPERVGLVYENIRLTWGEIQKRVNSLVNGLLTLGLKKGDRIAVLADNSHRYMEVYLAAAQAGFIIVPLNTMQKAVELKELITNAEISALFCGKNYLNTKNIIKEEIPEINYFIGFSDHDCHYDYEYLITNSSSNYTEINVNPDDIYVIAYTSGTTGKPKGAILNHNSCYIAAIIHALGWRISQADNYLFLGRLFFATGGPKFIPLLCGCKTVIVNFNPLETLASIEKEKISFFSTGPTIIDLLINHPDFKHFCLDSIRSIGFTSAPMPSSLWKKTNEILGEVGISTYGLTETNATGLILQPEDVYLKDYPTKVKRFGSIGKGMNLLDVKIADPEGREVSKGKDEIGEILIRGASVMQGYWKNTEDTEKALQDGWFYTGDLAKIDEDGYVYIVDRKKDIIISGGINISSREVEEVLYKHKAVNQAAVIGVPDEKWGETVKALVVLSKDFKVSERELIDFCKSNLASYKKPTSIDFLPDLPKTSSGKINKKKLREGYLRNQEKG
ncbi:MAG: class I adenylate-forming enzyme family protein [Thermodesulfobacteriota bacterium]|nr:class I adenylate-forming enzyme family protein [Thermodesulfobacteriota bacterium]